MAEISPELAEELAKAMYPTLADYSADHRIRSMIQRWADGEIAAIAPILSRALTEAYREGVEAREYGAAVDAYAANPYLTEKER